MFFDEVDIELVGGADAASPESAPPSVLIAEE